MRSLYWSVKVSRSSSVGPQYRDWHRAGVANIAATGFPAPMTSDSDTSCSGHGGLRVQIGSTPSGFATVGDAARGAGVPATGACGWACTWKASGPLRCDLQLHLTTPAASRARARGDVDARGPSATPPDRVCFT